MTELLIISADGTLVSAGPLYVATIAKQMGITTKVLPFVNELSAAEIELFIRKNCSNDTIIGISTTFIKREGFLDSILAFIEVAKSVGDFRFVVGGAGIVSQKDRFPENTIFLEGQNREQEIISLFKTLFPNSIEFEFDFTEFAIDYSIISGVVPKGIPLHLEVSRGCLFDCSFCHYPLRRTKSKFKSATQIKKEVETFFGLFGTTEVILLCNTFNDNEEKVKTVQEAFNQLPFKPRCFAYTRLDLFEHQSKDVKDFYQEYVKYVFFGVEGTNKDSLRILNKTTNVDRQKQSLISFRKSSSKDTLITTSYIIGLPGEDRDQSEYFKWVEREQVADFVNLSPLSVNTPNTVVFEQSTFEKNHKEFGFRFLTKEEATTLISSKLKEIVSSGASLTEIRSRVPWVNDKEGNDFIDAFINAKTLSKLITNKTSYFDAIFMNARGKEVPKNQSLDPTQLHPELYRERRAFLTEYRSNIFKEET